MMHICIDNLQWNVNHNSYIFLQEKTFENVNRKIAAILSPLQCVKDAKNLVLLDSFMGPDSLTSYQWLQAARVPSRFISLEEIYWPSWEPNGLITGTTIGSRRIGNMVLFILIQNMWWPQIVTVHCWWLSTMLRYLQWNRFIWLIHYPISHSNLYNILLTMVQHKSESEIMKCIQYVTLCYL